jgi:hypothetical protein
MNIQAETAEDARPLFLSKRHVLGDPKEFIHTHYKKSTESSTLTNLFNRRVTEVSDYKDLPMSLNKSQSNSSLETQNFVSHMRLIKGKKVSEMIEQAKQLAENNI